jgi:hypothetical protein
MSWEQTVDGGLPVVLIYLPTLALYGFLAWSIVRFCKRRDARYVAFALAPFAWWAFSLAAGSNSKARAEREHAATALAALPTELPDTIVFEGKAAFPMPAQMRKFSSFHYAIYVRTNVGRGQPPRTRIHKYDLRDPRAIKPDLITILPERYVAFRAKEASAYWKDGDTKAADGGPFEMRYVDGSGDSLIGLYYHRYVPVPAFPPLLSLDGWSPGTNSIPAKDLRALMLEFMSSSLRRT